MDKLSPERRSQNMRRITARNTKPEIAVRSLLHRLGFRFRIHSAALPGKPDVVLKRHGAVVLVHGCFWHQHARCIDGRTPRTNSAYWGPKLARNVARDRKVRASLRKLGYRVVVVWECELTKPERLERKLLAALRKPAP